MEVLRFFEFEERTILSHLRPSGPETNNSPFSTFSNGRTKNLCTFVLFRTPLDQPSPGTFSFSEVWIFNLISHFEKRLEDRSRFYVFLSCCNDRLRPEIYHCAKPCYVMCQVFFSTKSKRIDLQQIYETVFLVFPGHASHEKGLQRQRGADPLVSSQERRALFVSLINRWSSAFFCSSIGLHRISFVRASDETFKSDLFDALGGTRDGCLLGEPIRRRPVLPGPAPPRPANVRRPDPTHPWYLRVFDSTGYRHLVSTCGRLLTSFSTNASQIFQISKVGYSSEFLNSKNDAKI